jgi:REP element-mobilizing transposase RayT
VTVRGHTRAHKGLVGEAFRPPATPPREWLPTRQRNRLPLDAYRQPGAFFVTIATHERAHCFAEREVTEHCIAALRAECAARSFDLLAFCFMPDHVHLLVSTDAGSDLVGLVHSFKQRTAWWFRNRDAAGGLKASPPPGPRLWQKSYYDHVVRDDEALSAVVRYIIENPARARLVESPEDYPYSWDAYGILEAV